MDKSQQFKFGKVISSNITALNFSETVGVVEKWISEEKDDYICICNTHSAVTASQNALFKDSLDNAGICTPDGTPLVWALRLYGYKNQDRVDGPNLMLKLCELSSQKGYRIFLYGGTNDTLDKLERVLKEKYKNVNIVGKYSPPFRPLEETEEKEIARKVNETNPDLVFVSLGCPKQEIWMHNNKDSIKGIMIGVGAAFGFIIGEIKRPPIFFQKMGLEWLFRLVSEPKRLWKRYAYNNPVYIYRFLKTYRKNKKYTLSKNYVK
ncbi:WecB/TagA/CpsF family glycosyltransferase [Priestia megaterium]|uniref:WecB/TagA/CpsF family glycosyltransferase n=1 Tax=Priestia megaterium TaxID=1404 RepID=UPI003458241D